MSDDTLYGAADAESVIAHLLGMAHSLSNGIYEPLAPIDAAMLKTAATLLRQQAAIVVTTDYQRGCPCS